MAIGMGTNMTTSTNTTFDKDAFAEYIRRNVSKKEFGEGYCAKHVRLALFAAGRKLNNWPVSAKDWGGSLLALSFDLVPQVAYGPQKGDIAVVQPANGDDKHGHMQGYDGKNWVSDFVQRDFWPGPTFRANKPAYVIYRYGAVLEKIPSNQKSTVQRGPDDLIRSRLLSPRTRVRA